MKALLATLGAALVATAALAATAPAAPVQHKAMNDTIVGVAAGDARFSTLVSLVKKAGLVGTLSAKGPYTVFAPTNAAFAKLKRSAPDTYAAVASDKALLKKVLTYHVLAKKVGERRGRRRGEAEGSVKTVQGEKIELSLKGGKLYLNGNSQVIVADVAASNGVIHAINTVLVPPSAG